MMFAMTAALGVEIRSKLGDLTQAVTRDGATIRLEVVGTWPKFASVDAIVLDPAGHERARASMPYPHRGFGGHGFVLSSRGTYLALYWYTGQSEQACEVFTLTPLARVAGLKLARGEGYGPAFAEDESALVLASSTNPELRVEENADGDPVDDPLTRAAKVRWAEVRALALPSGEETSCVVVARLAKGSPAERSSGFYPKGLVVENDAVRFDGGWGELRVPRPFDKKRIVVDGPPANLARPAYTY